jgi:tetratricopeptide (TPR) repeat protein
MSYCIRGNTQEGDRYLQKGFALLGQLAEEHPRVPRFRLAASEALIRLMLLKQTQGDMAEANRHLGAALIVLKKLAGGFPDCPEYRRHLAQGHITLGNQLLALRNEAEAEKAFREGVQLWTRAAADFPNNREFRLAHGNSCASLSQFLVLTGRRPEAEEALQETLRIHQCLVADFPREAECHAAIALDHAWAATNAENQQRLAEALEHYSRCIASLEAALNLYPRQKEWLSVLQATFQKRSFVLLRQGKQAEYEGDLQRAREIEQRLDPAGLRLHRIRQRLAEGQLALAVKEANDVYLDDDLPAAECGELAAVYVQAALAVPDAAAKEAFAAHAVKTLRRAIDAGYTSGMPLGEHPDFRALAARADFKQLPPAAQR